MKIGFAVIGKTLFYSVISVIAAIPLSICLFLIEPSFVLSASFPLFATGSAFVSAILGGLAAFFFPVIAGAVHIKKIANAESIVEANRVFRAFETLDWNGNPSRFFSIDQPRYPR